MSDIPFAIRNAASGFHRHRADYYSYVASILRSSGGSMKFMQLFENDIERFKGMPRGKLCEFWLGRYASNGANLAETWQGTLPDDEVAIVRVAQDAGGDALIVAVDDLARMAKLTDEVKRQTMMTLFAAILGVGIAMGMLTAFPVFSVAKMQDTYSFLPVEHWGRNGKKLLDYAAFVESNVVYFIAAIIMLVSYVHWTFDNLIHRTREWLDEHVVLYRTLRDLKGALFLATMSTLTKRRGNTMFTLKQSLEIFVESARTPWMKWRIEQVIDGADATGAIDIKAFNTGFLSRDMYYFLEDMDKAKGFAEGLEETGKYVESTILQNILKRMNFYRWLLLMSSLIIAFAMFGWQFNVLYEMRGAMSNYLASG